MMQWRVTAVASLVGFLLALGSPISAADKPDAPDNIKELKEQRLALLVKFHQATKARHQRDPASVPLREVHKTMLDVLAARVDLAETPQARIKVCEDAVKYAGEWEGTVKDRIKDGTAPASDALKAQAYVIECRIALAKAKAQSENKQPKDTAAPEDAALLKKRVVLARKAYHLVERTFGEIKRTAGYAILVVQPEDVYTWSVRLLQAERDVTPRDAVAAVEGHIKRIKELEKKVKLLREVLTERAEFDVEWYGLEAQQWLAEAKARAKNKDNRSGAGAGAEPVPPG